MLSRKLCYPLLNPLVVDGDTPNDTVPVTPVVDIFPVDEPDTRIDIVLNLSFNEYLKIASSVDVGRDIAYGTDTNLIWWIWTRSLIASGVMTCEQIADCIENDSLVSSALSNWLTENNYNKNGMGTEFPDTYTDNPELLTSDMIPGCDPDLLFGMVTQFIDAVDSQITSFFEILEAQSNGFERTAIIAEAIPGSDQAGFDTVAAGFDQALEEIAENYAANWTPELRDQFRCDLFCLIKDTCELDFQVLADHFMSKVSASITSTETFGDAVSWFISGTWIGSQIPEAAFALVLQGIAYGQRIMNMSLSWITKGIAASLNDPDSDWMTLCEECDDIWCYEFNLSAFANYDFSIDGGNQFAGTFAGGKWSATTANTSSGKVTGIFIDFDMSSLVGELSGVTNMELEYTAIQGIGVLGTDYAGRVMLRSAANTTIYDSLSSAPTQPTWGTAQTWNFAFTSFGSTQKIRLLQSVDVTSGTPSGNGEITAFRLYGTGTPPSFANC